jgi:hypothetical protein
LARDRRPRSRRPLTVHVGRRVSLSVGVISVSIGLLVGTSLVSRRGISAGSSTC